MSDDKKIEEKTTEEVAKSDAFEGLERVKEDTPVVEDNKQAPELDKPSEEKKADVVVPKKTKKVKLNCKCDWCNKDGFVREAVFCSDDCKDSFVTEVNANPVYSAKDIIVSNIL